MSVEKFKAYSGSGKYAFVSYSHRDGDIVYKIINQLHDEGYNIWYDEGIPPVADYGGTLMDRIKSCEQFVFFISKNSVQSSEVVREVLGAVKYKKPIVQVVIEEAEFPSNLEYQLPFTLQKLMMNKLPLIEFYDKLHTQLEGCRDSGTSNASETSVTTSNITSLTGFKVGDYITFGRYPQGANGEVEPLDWKVLAIENGKALLITEMAIDCKQYNEELEKITWAHSDLRRWANNEFFDTAFSRAEQRRITVTHNKNEDNPDHGTKGGDDTQDRVFCLSIGEAKKYFSSDDERMARPTAYAKAQGAFVSNIGNCWWWLRSPGFDSDLAAGVSFRGGVNSDGGFVSDDCAAVRLALWLNL